MTFDERVELVMTDPATAGDYIRELDELRDERGWVKKKIDNYLSLENGGPDPADAYDIVCDLSDLLKGAK